MTNVVTKKDSKGRILYCKNCDYCSSYYEGRGMFFCSWECSNLSDSPRTKISNKLKIFHKLFPNKVGFKDGHKSFLTDESKKKISDFIKKFRSGMNHPCWKGGISPIRTRLQHSYKYKEWRDQVFYRDNYTCQSCYQKGNNLIPHHMNPFRFAKLLNYLRIKNPVENLYEAAINYPSFWNPAIGITLCRDCHNKIHHAKI